MSTEKSSVRSAYWDNIKGLLIILVVFAHILYGLQTQAESINTTVDLIYTFHMPAFVFVSGFFGKSERSHSFAGIIRLIFLYFIFNSLIGFLYGFSSLLVPMYSYWYLLALIAWRLTAHHLAKLPRINQILTLTALLIGFFPSVDNTLAASRIIAFYPFYMSGYMLTADKSDTLRRKPYAKRLSSGLIALLGTAGLAVFSCLLFRLTDDALLMSGYADPSDLFGRILLFLTAFLSIRALRFLSPDRTIPLLTMFGRNSLWIFLLHRPVTLLISRFLTETNALFVLLIAVAAAFLICLAFGNDKIVKPLNRFAEDGAAIFTSPENKKINAAKIAALTVALGFLISIAVGAYSGLDPAEGSDDTASSEISDDIIWPVMSAEQKQAFDDAFRITFAGDLILLEDQVKRAYNGKDYDFSEVFDYAEPYIASADFSIGVFEGPAAGPEAGYTSSNFDDGKSLYLNFPDSFASAIKNAGFDLVTTANNHLLDKGRAGALRTLDVLDAAGLDHTGSYRSAEEKAQNRVKLVECQGIRMAVLSYTYGSNYTDNALLTNGSLSFLTSVISGTNGSQFEQLKQSVEEDFKAAKALSPDLIVVLPHIGTQFSNEPDSEQTVWFNIFKENGADIILGDHPHVVEPALIEPYQDRNVFIGYCPGNFANIYRENQGDTSMLTDVYIDRSTKKVIGGSVVPLYTHARADGNYRAVPIYEIMNNKKLRSQLTTDDLENAADANAIVSEVVFGHSMDITSVTERYYFNENGFLRTKAEALSVTDEMKSGTLYTAMEQADTVCFIGDSVTEGTKNGGCPWYEPLAACFPETTILQEAKGGCTVSYMTQRADEIPAADLYVIALGTNDVRYRDKSICAMTTEQFVSETDTLRTKLSAKAPDAAFIFIAPWYSTDGDPFCRLSYSEKTELNEAYSAALDIYCKEHRFGFINANPYIRDTLTVTPDRTYLLDHIHPNATTGVRMYSEAVLTSG